VAVWYLYSETEEPLGQTYRGGEDAVPAPGDPIEHAEKRFEVVSHTEPRGSCAMRRFGVVLRAAYSER
jgi:hypothetical protein